METINSILLIAQVILSIFLIVLVLMQHGKGADAGAAFGSGASSTVFGSKGSGNFMTKTTSVVGLLFFATCMSLAYVGSNRNAPDSVLQSVTTMDTQVDQQSVDGSDLPPADNSNETSVSTDLPPAN